MKNCILLIIWISVLKLPTSAQEQEGNIESLFRVLEKGLVVKSSANCQYPESGLKYHVDPGSDPAKLVHAYTCEMSFLEGGVSCSLKQYDKHQALVHDTLLGFSNSLSFGFDNKTKVMAVGSGKNGLKLLSAESRGIEMLNFGLAFLLAPKSREDLEGISFVSVADLPSRSSEVLEHLKDLEGGKKEYRYESAEFTYQAIFDVDSAFPKIVTVKEKGLLHIEFEVLAWQEVRGALLPQKIRQKLYFEDTEVREILLQCRCV